MSIKNMSEKSSHHLNPFLGLAIAIAAVSSASIMIRFAQRDFPTLFIASARLGIACLLLFPFFIRKDKSAFQSLTKRDFLTLGGAGLFLALHFASWIQSLEMTNVISSVVLVTTTPIWVSLISFFIFQERLNKLFYLGLVIAMTGVVIISAGEGYSFMACMDAAPSNPCLTSSNLGGNLLALTGAICAAGYILCGKMVRIKLDNLSYIFSVYLIASVVLITAALLFTSEKIMILRPEFGWVVLVAVIPQLIGHSLINWSLGHLPASYVSLSLLGEPVGSALLALVFLREQPSTLQFTGAFVIMLGLFIATKPVGEKTI
jgi:drug/metabolite transporter (DMT)-like permease